ncbi:MAG: GNAT family protein [Planctomycetota bacterium]|jgi:GNAT superfamily N-acetyltransferase
MSGDLHILEADTSALRKQFLDLPFRLYRDDPNWVAPLRMAQAKIFKKKTAFFKNADMNLYLAERDGRPVGRVAAIHNQAHNDQHGDTMGFFGFFECADDPDAAKGLIETTDKWLAGRGLDAVRGPVNPSMNAECGFLIEGFDSPPVALMPYNPDFYPRLVEAAGFAKCKDLFAYIVRADKMGNSLKRMERIRETLKRRHPEVTVRTIDLANYQEEILQFMGVFEEARRNNWGYVPVSEEEILETAKDLRSVADPEIILFAEVDGEPAGAFLAIPDINQALGKINGRLFPFGFIKLLRALKRIDAMRTFGIAALEKYRHLGITAMLLVEAIHRAMRRGYTHGEASWVLEDNLMSNRTITKSISPELYKTYRIYEKPIQA